MTGFPKPSSSNNNTWILPVLLSSGISVATVLCGYWAVNQHEKHLRSKWLEEEDQKQKDSTTEEFDVNAGQSSTYSVIGHFKSLKLGPQSTILEANRRRTTSYYEKAREAHEQSLVLGIHSYSELLKKRKEELDRLLSNHREGKRSLRTVIVMLDSSTQKVLSEARQKILQPLNYSWDIYHKGVWIPEVNMIPNEDMHVTVACPWWWHTIREGNHELNKNLSNRLRQALVIDFHHPFVIELERIILLGGKTLVALWRTVGDRVVEAGESGSNAIVVCDRHATAIDPMVRLRREIVDCFTNNHINHNFRPLTHQDRKTRTDLHNTITNPTNDTSSSQALKAKIAQQPPMVPPPIPNAQKPVRTHTIESKTPGLGSGDGFIHTTLCRLPLECFSNEDIELEPIHRLCREATATYSGHRMLVHKFRFVETTGEGGDSNPCKNPRFDATMEAPLRLVPRNATRQGSGGVDGAFPSNTNKCKIIGGIPSYERNALTTGRAHGLIQDHRKGVAFSTSTPGGVEGLFDPPSRSISSSTSNREK